MYKFCSFLHNTAVEANSSLKRDAVKKSEKGEQWELRRTKQRLKRFRYNKVIEDLFISEIKQKN